MNDLKIFENIDISDIERMMKCFEAKRITYKKDRTILSNMINLKVIGIMIEGTANMIRYDYNGNRTILEKLERDSVFGEVFSYLGNDISIVATSDCEILFIDYQHLIKRCKKSCLCHSLLIDNVLQILSKKII